MEMNTLTKDRLINVKRLNSVLHKIILEMLYYFLNENGITKKNKIQLKLNNQSSAE